MPAGGIDKTVRMVEFRPWAAASSCCNGRHCSLPNGHTLGHQARGEGGRVGVLDGVRLD